MAQTNKLKIFNDPIYGFISIPNALIFDLISHPYFQRLRRISQMGLSYLVYPGAHHTRFHHALGSMFLMQKAVQNLRIKKVEISKEEELGLLIAILLHDIGHGPFSHALEHMVVKNVHHEQLSLRFMELLNETFDNQLSLAIQIFKGEYPRQFLNQMVSSQLDMDRLDYLRRDSFFTGVSEGNVNSERLLSMLNVVDNQLVVEEKGIYSVEKFLMARRFMYWQVYLHKTGLGAEQLLIQLIKRARYLVQLGEKIPCSDELYHFLEKETITLDFTEIARYALLDDIDVLSAIKSWQKVSDKVLARLSRMLINRELYETKIKKNAINEEKVLEKQNWVMDNYQLSAEEASYFVFTGTISNQAYNAEKQSIKILKQNGKVVEVIEASDHLSSKALSKITTKHFICFPKESVNQKLLL